MDWIISVHESLSAHTKVHCRLAYTCTSLLLTSHDSAGGLMSYSEWATSHRARKREVQIVVNYFRQVRDQSISINQYG